METQGGKILLDGRGCSVAEYPDGNFVGPTIVEVTTDMDAYKYVCDAKVKANDRNEIFGPVLSIVAAETMDEAIEIINANK